MDVAVPHDQRHINTDDAVEAMQATGGLSPAGSDASIRARLDRIDTEIDSTSAATTPIAAITDSNSIRVQRTRLATGGYVVHLYGKIRNGKVGALVIGDDLFTIPAGYLPVGDQTITIHNVSANTFGTATIGAGAAVCEAGLNAAGVASTEVMWFHASWETV